MARLPLLAPVAVDDVVTTAQGVPIFIDLLANDYDPNGDNITINYINTVRLQRYNEDILAIDGGVIHEINNGKVTFTPDAGFVGQVTFTYLINDRNFWINGRTDEGTVTINVVNSVNTAPSAANDTAATVQNTAVVIDVLANDSDGDGDTLTILSFDAPANGAVAENPNGTLTYTPDSGFFGVDTFSYTVSDGNGGSDTASVSVSVAAGNQAPVAVNDVAGTVQDMAVTIDVLANDTDLNGDTLSILNFGAAANGFITANPGGTLTYVPEAGFVGIDAFAYTVTDGNGGTDTAAVAITVAPRDSAALEHTFQNGVAGYTGVDDTYLHQASPNAGFGAASSLNIDQSDGGGQVHGLVQFSGLFGSGSGQIGATDRITSAILYLDAFNQGDPISLHEMLVPWSEASTWNSMGGGIQADGSEASAAPVAVTGSVGAGVLSIDVTASLTAWQANPAANFGWAVLPNGPDGVDFSSSETGAGPRLVVQYDPGTGGGNNAPIAADDAFDVDAGALLTGNLLADNGAGPDSDPDGDPLVVATINGSTVNDGQVVVLPSGAGLTINSSGGFDYDQNGVFAALGHGQSAADSFTYSVTDSHGGTSTGTVTVNVAAPAVHDPGTPQHDEHKAVFDLVKHADATHVAVNNGSWFDPATWQGNLVPGDDAKVLIQDGVAVAYDGVSAARLMTVRVDGELHFATGTDSKMIVDTLVVDTGGTLTAGTQSNPVEAGVNVDIVIADNGDIDTSWDPNLISRGFISHGKVEIHGQEKTTHLKVAHDPMAGDTSLTLAEVPVNWQIGDTIVLTGTQYDGYIWPNSPGKYREPQDEILTITAINNDTVHFATPLQYDHHTPRSDLKASVANYTRNVSVESELGSAAETHHRGHVMFMHNDDVDVRFAEFTELGRTDKSILALNAHEFGSIAADSNVKGRYSFHLHKTGTGNPMEPAIAEGNAVFGSPGWGFVHHDSHAVLNHNATYNTFGAGYVAETGNETGTWTDNIAIYAKGINWSLAKNQNDGANFDTAKGGDGFFFQGRMVKAVDNVAASVNHGFTYFHRGRYDDIDAKLDGQIPFAPSNFELPEALGKGPTDPDKTPILKFSGNEVFAANEGVHIVKNNPYQGFDIHSKLDNFTAWEVNTGAYFDYMGHYVLEDFDLIAKQNPERAAAIGNGIIFGQNAVDMSAVNLTIDSFKNGINLKKNFSFNEDISVTQYKVVNATFLNIQGENLANYTPGLDEVLTSAELDPNTFSIDLDLPLYFDPASPRVKIIGTKTDSIGTIDIPAGTDGFAHNTETYGYNISKNDVIHILENDGYYSAGGKNYFILESYYTDRATGDIHKYGHVVEMANVMKNYLGQAVPYQNAVYNGALNLSNAAPVTQDDSIATALETDVIIDVLQNDWDPNGDALEVDGIVQPLYGTAFDNGDGTITYRPGLNFVGAESFKYWASDDQGGFTEAIVTVDVWDV